MDLAPPLRAALIEVAAIMAPARHDWWVIASAALALHGADPGPVRDIDVLFELDRLLHASTHCGLGATACNPLRDTILKFRPAYEQHLQSLHFAPGFDLDAELSTARALTGRDDAAAHFER